MKAASRRAAIPIKTRFTSEKDARITTDGPEVSTANDHVNSVESWPTARIDHRSAMPLTAGHAHRSTRKANASSTFQANTVSSNEDPNARIVRRLPTP